MSQEIILLIRRDKECWIDDKYKHFLWPYMSHIIDIWDASFKISIVDFRKKLRDIAASTYINSKFDKILLHSHIDHRTSGLNFDREKELYSNSIIVSIDEDDWLSTSLPSVLREIETDKEIFVWNCYTTWDGLEKISFPSGSSRIIETCNWGIKGFEQLLTKRNQLNGEEHSKIHFIRKPLSVRVNHLAMLGMLRNRTKKHSPGTEDKNIFIQKLTQELSHEINFPEEFQYQWKQYRETLKELLSSYKYLTDEYKELL